MEHDATTFWSDIKKYEDALAKDPGSYCFAPLAELYRKMGLLDEAITVAKKGCDLHPDYVGGHMALGRAFFEKGMKSESKEVLEKVVGFTPDNLMALKILSQIYAENGQNYAAEQTIRMVLAQNPADSESQELLDSLKKSPVQELSVTFETPDSSEGGESPASGAQSCELSLDDEEIIEDAEIIEELTDEEPAEVDFNFTPPGEAFSEPEKDDTAEGKDPLITVTMAELYVSQGFIKRALTIYRELLDTDPENADWKNRLYELKAAIDEDTAIARGDVAAGKTAEADSAQSPGQPDFLMSEDEKTLPAAPDTLVLGTLEKWLETIRRKR